MISGKRIDDPASTEQARRDWIEAATKALKGATVTNVDLLTKKECDDHMWDETGVVIELKMKQAKGPDKIILIYPSADDEGNSPGALFTTIDNLGTIPVFPLDFAR